MKEAERLLQAAEADLEVALKLAQEHPCHAAEHAKLAIARAVRALSPSSDLKDIARDLEEQLPGLPFAWAAGTLAQSMLESAENLQLMRGTGDGHLVPGAMRVIGFARRFLDTAARLRREIAAPPERMRLRLVARA